MAKSSKSSIQNWMRPAPAKVSLSHTHTLSRCSLSNSLSLFTNLDNVNRKPLKETENDMHCTGKLQTQMLELEERLKNQIKAEAPDPSEQLTPKKKIKGERLVSTP